MHNHSSENEFNLHVNEISFSYDRMSTKTRFEREAKGNSEMAYLSNKLISLPTTQALRPITWTPKSYQNIHNLPSEVKYKVHPSKE